MEPTLTVSLQKSVVTADGNAALQDLLGRLQGMREVYQDLHWNSAGPAFYADHQLFERLYSAVVGEVDALAEKIVGLTGAQLSPVLTAARLGGNVSSMVGAGAAGADFRMLGMLELERAFCEKVIPEVLGTLRMTAELSEGLQNFMQGLADTHEGHVYLLDRRLADPSLTKGWDVSPRASGSAVAEDVARKELLDRAGDGIGPDGLEGMTARHHPDVVKKLVKDLTERGILVQRDGQLHRGLVGPKELQKGPHMPPKAVFKPAPVGGSTPPAIAPADPSQARVVARNIARNNREAGITLPEQPKQLRPDLPEAPHQEK